MSVISTLELKDRLAELQGSEVTLRGWIRNHRKQKNMGFIDFFDGLCFKNPQVVYDNNIANFEEIQALRVGSAITVKGTVVPSYKDPTTPEVQATEIVLEGDCPEDYPLQPKRHSIEFLREIGYLRPRTRLFQAVFRVRSVASMAIHTYFQDRGYLYVHTPLITGNDAEGAGNTFTVTTLDPRTPASGMRTSSASRLPWPSPVSWRARPSPWPSPRSTPLAPPSARRTPTPRPTRLSSG